MGVTWRQQNKIPLTFSQSEKESCIIPVSLSLRNKPYSSFVLIPSQTQTNKNRTTITSLLVLFADSSDDDNTGRLKQTSQLLVVVAS